MKRLVAVLFIALAVSCARVRPPASEVSLSSSDPVVVEAWNAALHLAQIHERWAPPTAIVLFRFEHPEVWGQTFFYTTVEPDGRPVPREQIVLYCPTRGGSTLVRNVLIHEMLHCIHARLKLIDPNKYREIEDERFVCGLGACPLDPRQTPIHAGD